MSKDKKIITISSIIICFVLIFIYCLSPLHVGINSGGLNTAFENSVGLSGINDGHFYIKYNITENFSDTSNLFSNLIKTIVSITDVFADVFDIRIISFIYMIFLLISIFYLNKYINLGNMLNNIIFAALTIFIFFDLSYLVYLNTFYSEAAFYVFFVFGISLYIKLVCSKKPQFPTTLLFFLTAILLCTLKSDLFLLVIPFVIMSGYLFYIRKGYMYRITVAALSVLLVVSPFITSPAATDTERDKFNSVFYGVLYENDEELKALSELGIDNKYEELVGKNTYEELPDYVKTEEFSKDFYNKVTERDIFKYYLTNPSEYLSQYKYVGYNALETYPKYSGNFTADSGKPADAKAGGFKLYNFIKEKLFPKTLWFFYIVPVLTIILLLGYRKKMKNNGITVMGIAVSVASLILFNIPMINSGLFDISRTMSIYNVAFDTMVMILVSILLYITSERKKEFKDKYGLSQ